ncbi:MAG: prepilin peptidase [Candidatus Fermentibacteraceae bacterium]|nr:prepilin peptidase [Candidatus Fermentibacteraceae bacterium]MBN2608102.1 prepilin peptidase [Candidatus Fermentibacteraceae bacterium]
MRAVYLLFSFLFGSAVGSFLNVVAWRVPRGESIVRPSSRCTSCGTAIKWHDNIPVVSWFFLRGRCRSCGGSFSFRYALVELVTGLLFLGLFLRFGPSWLWLKHSVFISLLICTILTDIDHWIILDSVSIGGIAAGLLFTLAPGTGDLLPHLITAAAAFLVFFLIRTVAGILLRGKPGYTIAPEGHEDESRDFQGGMGWGDIKLAGMIGAFLGPSLTAVALFLSFLTGALTGIAVIIAGRNRRIPLPFGPFLALGSVLAVFAGQAIWELYLRLGLSV